MGAFDLKQGTKLLFKLGNHPLKDATSRFDLILRIFLTNNCKSESKNGIKSKRMSPVHDPPMKTEET